MVAFTTGHGGQYEGEPSEGPSLEVNPDAQEAILPIGDRQVRYNPHLEYEVPHFEGLGISFQRINLGVLARILTESDAPLKEARNIAQSLLRMCTPFRGRTPNEIADFLSSGIMEGPDSVTSLRHS